jgi:hypothetical protein
MDKPTTIIRFVYNKNVMYVWMLLVNNKKNETNYLVNIICITHTNNIMTTINLENVAANVPSMCIPRTFMNISRGDVYKTINELNLGVIDRVDMVYRKNEKGTDFQRIFIHFKRWYSNSVADNARTLLLSGKEIKIIYDDPWFWKISANRAISRPNADMSPNNI